MPSAARKNFPPTSGIESEQLTQSAKKINYRAKSVTHIILYPIVSLILDKRAAMILQPFVGVFQLIFKMFLCPANFHSREAEGEFVVLPQSAIADSSLKEGAKGGRHLSLTGLIFDSVGEGAKGGVEI